jgi:hypothetical protein
MINIFALVLLFAMALPLWAGERTLTPEAFDRFGGTHIRIDDKGNIWTAFYDLKGDIHIRNASGGEDLVINEEMVRAPGGIGFDVQGDNAYVVWREKIGGKKLWFRASCDGGKTLGNPILLDDQNAPLTSIVVRSNAKGDIFILYLGEAIVGDSKYNLYFTASHDFGKTFLKPQNLTLGYENSIYPVLFADGDGVYMFSDSGKKEKRFMIFRRSTDGGRTWSKPFEIMKETAGAVVYIEPFRSGKRLHVLWLTAVGDEHVVAAAFSDDDGQTWKSRYLEDTKGMDIGEMSVANDPEGHLYLVFCEKSDILPKEKMKVFVMRSEDNGKTWEKPLTLRHYPFENTRAVNPHIIAAEKGVVVAVWVDYRNIRSNLYMQFSKDYGKTWQEKDIPLEEPGRFNTAHYPLTKTLARVGDTYYELAYRFKNDLITTEGNADLLLMDFKLEKGGVK